MEAEAKQSQMVLETMLGHACLYYVSVLISKLKSSEEHKMAILDHFLTARYY